MIELLTELRWLPPGLAMPGQLTPQMIQFPTALFANLSKSAENFYAKFGNILGAEGFTHSERLVPHGFPPMPFAPVYRYSQSGTRPGEPVFQLGPGVFSAHITPPYKSWDKFRPYVEIGVKALLQARGESERDAQFTNATVRYLDCFTEAYLEGRSESRFLTEVLGIEINPGPAILKQLAEGKEITPSLQLSIPLTEERTMELSLAHGVTPVASGLIMNTAVTTARGLPPVQVDVMRFLDDSRVIISDTFVEMTRKLQPLMKPEK